MTSVGSLQVSTFSLPALTVVIGGARSGKSRIAEQLVVLSGRPKLYLATAQAFDDEMNDRIRRHRRDRGEGWETLEVPLDVAPLLPKCQPKFTLLFDCATLWLSNHLLADSDLDREIDALLAALSACPAPVVLVSNEVGAGIVPENALARRFRDEQGRLNQRLAAQADLVVGVMAGLPFALKGDLPKGFA